MKLLPPAIEALQGCLVTRLTVDDSITLSLRGNDRQASLRIDGRGSLTRDDKILNFDPDSDPASVGCLLMLLHGSVTDVSLAGDGELALDIGGARLRVDPDDHQVSWHIEGTAGQASCIAEGKVIWQ